MTPATCERLNAINLAFYREHAEAFSRTRSRPWRGMSRVVAAVPGAAPRVLDIGCGNARLLLALRERFGRELTYHGVDASAELLSRARTHHPQPEVQLQRCDFVAQPAERALPDGENELVALLGVLLHVPGERTRGALLQAAARRLAPGGVLAFTLYRLDQDSTLCPAAAHARGNRRAAARALARPGRARAGRRAAALGRRRRCPALLSFRRRSRARPPASAARPRAASALPRGRQERPAQRLRAAAQAVIRKRRARRQAVYNRGRIMLHGQS